MNQHTGTNKKGVKSQNQSLVLKLIATHPGLSRVNMARRTGLTKMTVGNIVSELLDLNLIQEYTEENGDVAPVGRSPVSLRISDKSPCILGISIKRGLYQMVLADLSGTVLDRWTYEHDNPIVSRELVDCIKKGSDVLLSHNHRPLLGTGISCLGPINRLDGVILNPANFWSVADIPIVEVMEKHTGLPAFLINDGNSGALAEKTYGIGQDIDNFFYFHIMYGIGAGLVLEGSLYNGTYGQSGEIGHSTINFAGPKCNCGNTGCLELYANIDAMRRHIRELSALFPDSSISRHPSPTFMEVIDAANTGDYLAVAALDRFCDYLSHAITNTIMLLDLTYVITDYQSTVPGNVLETILHTKMSHLIHMQQYKTLQIVKSPFNGQAPLMGAVAVIADKVFQGELSLA